MIIYLLSIVISVVCLLEDYREMGRESEVPLTVGDFVKENFEFLIISMIPVLGTILAVLLAGVQIWRWIKDIRL